MVRILQNGLKSVFFDRYLVEKLHITPDSFKRILDSHLPPKEIIRRLQVPFSPGDWPYYERIYYLASHVDWKPGDKFTNEMLEKIVSISVAQEKNQAYLTPDSLCQLFGLKEEAK